MVEITIDTQKDTHEEIRSTIKYLQSIVGEVPSSGASMESSSAPATNAFSMFGAQEKSSGESTAPMNMFESATDDGYSDMSTIFSDDDAPSDYSPQLKEDEGEDPVIEIVEY